MSHFLGRRPAQSDESDLFETEPASVDGSKQASIAEDDKPKGRSLLGGCARLLSILLLLLLIVLLFGAISLLGSYLYLSDQLSGAIDQVVRYQGQGPGGTPRFFDRHGNLLMELKTAEKRLWLDYEDIPRVIIDATVAVEDDTFWDNLGFDPEAIAATALSNYRQQEGRPAGASTITQQLVRHIAFTYKERITPSYERKIREVFLAFILTQRRSKESIITMYLNEIYYGNLAYGIEAAAQTYFGKGAGELTLADAAFLAGLPQAPSDLDPYTNFDRAKERQEFILDLMVDEGMISEQEAETAKMEPVDLVSLFADQTSTSSDIIEAPHFVLYVKSQLEQRYGPEALYRGGWQIKTTLDLELQHFVEQSARDWVASRAAQHDVNNAAVVVLKPGTGEILAMLGSLDYFSDEIDGQVNVTLQPRQPGSSIKPITYSAAMERGWNTGDVIWDVPIELDLGDGQKMVPTNYDGRYHGPLLLRDALANSYNIPPIQLIRDIGVPSFISTGRKMGIESLKEPPGYYGLALTLGGGEVPLLEMTHAYATLANMGQRPHLNGVLQISNSRGGLVFDLSQQRLPPVNALDRRIAYIVTDILDDDPARAPAMGRNNDLDLPFPVAAKTGTTNDFRDNWTLGYTPGVVVGVWVGNTDGHPMRNSSGLRGAAPLWRKIMEYIYGDNSIAAELAVEGRLPPQEFPKVNGIEERKVCLPRGTGGSSCGATRTDLFITGGPIHAVQRLGYVPDTITNPGAWTLAVAPLSANRVSLPPLENGERPPNPTLCVINFFGRPTGTSTRLFLPIPPYYPDEVKARRWAAQSGYSMAPPVICPAGTAGGGSSSGGGDPNAEQDGGNAPAPQASVWRIQSPSPGEVVQGLVPIIGTAAFDPAEVQYYKLEIGEGVTPSTWSTFGTTHSQSVADGVLETLQAGALAPGPYVIRLILVRNDGNYPTPYSVPITIGQ